MSAVRNTAGTGRAKRAKTLPIADKTALARVLGDIERQCGSQAQAARELGITPLHFWRLLHERGGRRISRTLFEAIKRTARQSKGPEEAEQVRLRIDAAVVAPGNLARLSEYAAWLRGYFRRYGAEVLLLLRKDPEGKAMSKLACGPDFSSRLETLNGLRKRSDSYFRSMERSARRAGHMPLRILLGQLRAIEELRDTERTGGIERHLTEWRDADLRKFLKAALRKEELLLDREQDVERAVLSAKPIPVATARAVKFLEVS